MLNASVELSDIRKIEVGKPELNDGNSTKIIFSSVEGQRVVIYLDKDEHKELIDKLAAYQLPAD